MADNIEIRLDRLTDAIKGLYAKSSTSQGEIYNALTSLSQRYENLTSISSEKIATTLVNEFRKTLEVKYGQTNRYIKDLENALKSFIASNSNQNPRMAAEVTKIVTDISNVYAKLNSQDLALQKIFNTVEAQKNNNTSAQEMAKLSENFLNFSKNFENITVTLNKNFADFLEQVKQNSSKNELKSLESELEIISGNVNSVISAISIIDTKYKDLTGLIGLVQSKENSFNDALREVRNLSDLMQNIKDSVKNLDTRQTFEVFYNDVTSKVEDLKSEINKIISSIQENSVKSEIYNLNAGINAVSNNVQNLYADLVSTNEELKNISKGMTDADEKIQNISSEITSTNEGIKNLSVNIIDANEGLKKVSGDITDTNEGLKNLSENFGVTNDKIETLSSNITGLGGEVKNIRNLINDEILYKSHQYQSEYEKYLNSAKEDIKALVAGLGNFKNDLEEINKGNIKVLQEPIVKAMDDLKNQDIGKDIKELSTNLKDVTTEIQASIQNMRESLNNINHVSGIHILNQMAEAIPEISEKLEIFRTHVVSDNSLHLSEIQKTFTDALESFKDNLQTTANKIEDDTKTLNIETLDALKIDLQRLSDHLIDSVESINDRIQKEFANYKTDFQEFSIRQDDNIERINDKLSALEMGLEGFGSDTIDKINDNLNANAAKSQDALNEIKSDILDGIMNVEKTNKNTLSQFEFKIDKLLNSYLGANLENISDSKSLRDTVVDIETKIDRTNLQQIHNAKELLEEIQSSTSDISMKITAIEESKNIATIMNVLSKITDRIQGLQEAGDELSDEFQNVKEEIDQKLKENVQKISALVEKTKDSTLPLESDSDIDDLSAKVSEYLSNFEYLKNNISQEIKENLADEFLKINNSIKKIKSSDENSSYTYSLEDVESDLAKIRVAIEKGNHNTDDIKLLYEKVIELRTVGLENVKINRDTETELGNISGWLRDTNNKIDDLSQNVEDVQKNALQEIRSQLIQSEKSKKSAGEFYTRIENALKHIIKTNQSADSKIAELEKKVELIMQAQNDAFNPSQFIDIFYENMTQTKMLSNRVEIIEDKINSIQNALEKLISYVEQ